MRRSVWIPIGVALALHAAGAQEIRDFLQSTAQALSDRNASAFEAAFDRPPAKLHTAIAALVQRFDVQSTLTVDSDTGDESARTVQLDWQLEAAERGNAGAITRRRGKVECRLKKNGDAWRIVSFTPTPADLFVPPNVDGAWTAVQVSAAGLTESAAPLNEGDVPEANTTKFLEPFDRSMPDFARFQDTVLGLEQSGTVQSSLDLVKNEGDDRVRTIAIDWLINLISRETRVSMVRRQEIVTLRVEKQGKNWRITDIQPRSFFAPPGAAQTPRY